MVKGAGARTCPGWRRLEARWRGIGGVALLLTLGCVEPGTGDTPEGSLRVATSASLEGSGLFAALAPTFERQSHKALAPSFLGTGQALALGRSARADVVWVHSRVSEDAFVSEGYGVNRRDVMYSEFVIVGPSDDPARIGGLSSAVQAFLRLSTTGAASFRAATIR